MLARLAQVPFAGAAVGVAVRPIWTDGVGPNHILDMSPFEVGPGEVGIGEIGVVQVGVPQLGPGKVGSREVGTLQVGVTEVGARQVGSSENYAGEIASGERCLTPEIRDGLPQHWMKVAVNVETPADDLAARVYGNGLGAADAAKRGELDHPAGRRPREGTRITSAITRADDLATVVHGHGLAEVKSFVEDTEIDHSTGRRP